MSEASPTARSDASANAVVSALGAMSVSLCANVT
jgi:hypothetical protein